MDFAPSVKQTLLILTLLCCLGCAEIGPPPGGEVDKVKPRILESIPANGSTNVEVSNTIIIRFSERINTRNLKRSIYISPRLIDEPTVKWKSDQVTITLPDSFAVNQTYIISFPDDVRDLRNNPLDSGSVIAFTTGETLSSGKIEGNVVDQQNQPQNNIVTALYSKADLDNKIIDSLYPLYLSVTNNDGYFSFQFIPEGEYLLLAFTDKNKNDKLDIAQELYGMTDRAIMLDSSQKVMSDLQITLSAHTETDLELLSVRQTNSNLIKIDFNNRIEVQHDQNLFNISLQKYSDSSKVYNLTYLIRPDSTYTNSIEAYFGVMDTGSYKLNFRQTANDTVITFDSIKVKLTDDKTNPSIKQFHPEGIKIFKDSANIYMQFSEPLDTSQISSETFYLLDNDSNFVLPKFEFSNQSFCKFSPDFLQDDISQYKLFVSEFDIVDLAGNKMGDSTAFKIINLINQDSLGVIRGTVTLSEQFQAYQNINLSYRNIETNQIFKQQLSDNSFENLLPQGKYFLSGYIDIDNNNKRDFGDVSSLKFAEPTVMYADTIKIRARFETTDIRLEFK